MNDATPCVAELCTNDADYTTPANLCSKHRKRWERTGSWDKARRYASRGGECAVEGCDAVNTNGSLGYCGRHYQQHLKGVEFTVAPNTPTEGCSFEGCKKPHHGRGYCMGHLGQLNRGKPLTPLRARRSTEGVCSGPSKTDGVPCGREIKASGLCVAHLWQHHNKGVLVPLREYQAKGGPCAAVKSECPNPATVEGMCATHRRWFLKGDPEWDRPIPPKAPNGSGHTDKNGYRHLTVKGMRKSEHVHFAEQILGRPLREGENVHHKNGNRSDNRTDGPFKMDDRGRLLSGNLEVWSVSQPAGQEIGPKLGWATEMVRSYGAVLDDARWAALTAAFEAAASERDSRTD